MADDPFDNGFPPPGPTMLKKVIPSYLYQQYSDDDDLQAFVAAYNDLAQAFHDWFLNLNLPIYTHPNIAGLTLDWVAEGLYGMKRPLLPAESGSNERGPLNTQALNELPLNDLESFGLSNGYVVDDDLFRRILTWHFWKGDGKVFVVRWLKRRIQRFLTGENGGPGNVDQTYDISVTFGEGNEVYINFRSTVRVPTGGALLNLQPLNTFALNELQSTAYHLPISPLVPVFKAAVDAGILELPFQHTWIVNIT